MEHDKQTVDAFFSSISVWESAYSHVGFSYFAIQKNGIKYLLQGRLFLQTAPSNIPASQFSSANIYAGHFAVSGLGVEWRDFITQVATHGRVKTPIGDLLLPTDDGGRVSAFFSPFHQEGIANGTRLQILNLSGANRHSLLQQPDADWELKAAHVPFDTTNELLNEYFLGQYRGDFANVEVMAFNVAAIDFKSVVSGSKAKPSIFLAKELDTNMASINYRVLLHGKVVARGTARGDSLKWMSEGHSKRGASDIDIPTGAVLHCVASYAGYAQHQGWIGDPSNFQNPRRAALEEIDEKLEVLKDYLFEEQRPRKESRDFEFGIAWLMWIYGFSVAQCGATSRTSDSVDIVGTTPGGNFVVVECTTGLLKAENKLAKLVERTEILRKRLRASGNGHLKVLSVMVTAKSRDEIRAELDQAKQLGVAIITKENLVNALTESIAAPNVDHLFDEAWEALKPKQESLGLLPT